ncbi:MAG: DNA-deoxyinosine glycosylase [Candidatus Caccovivens sp.]
MNMHTGFPPIYDEESRILILGSFPSVKSREAGFYYGNPQNRFWKMLENVFDEKISNDIKEKVQFLKKHKIALWDVVQESDLKGSADITLKKSHNKTADFAFLLPPNTKVEKILCNGKTAYNIFTQICQTDIPVTCLPSTSPANPRYNFSDWQNALK